MLVRTEFNEGQITLHWMLRDGFNTTFLQESATFADPRYADLLDEMQAVEGGEGYPDLLVPDLPKGPTFSLADWPAGTIMRIWNEGGESTDYTDPGEPMTLVDPGTYTIQVAPPLPYHTVKGDIEVSDA